jgi:NADH-quinone oxidoreductase subunit L
MRKMSGLKRVLPLTNIVMLVGCLALAGFPMFSGFFSKDEIVAAAWYQNKFLGVVLLTTAFLTAYYTFRLYFRVFQGPLILPESVREHGGAHGHQPAPHDAHKEHHSHEPAVMMIPLVILAIGALLAGYLNWPERERSLSGLLHQSPSIQLAHRVAMASYPRAAVLPGPFGAEEADTDVRKKMADMHTRMMAISGLVAAMGIYVAFLLHRKYRAYGEELPYRFPRINRLLEGKFWVDEVYQAGIVETLRRFGRWFFAFDNYAIDGLIWIVSFMPQLSGFSLKLTTQRGSLQGYAALMLLALAVIFAVVFL